MSQQLIEINEKTSFEKNIRVNHLNTIAKQSTENLELLARLASLSSFQISMIKKHPLVKKYLK